jgi:DNA-binding HxlR family transcriptional regulator
MKKPSKAGHLDPAAICRSSDPMAVRELLTKIRDRWTIFLILSLDLLGGRARFSELERAVPGISQRMLSSTLKNLERDGLVVRETVSRGASPRRVRDYRLNKEPALPRARTGRLGQGKLGAGQGSAI